MRTGCRERGAEPSRASWFVRGARLSRIVALTALMGCDFGSERPVPPDPAAIARDSALAARDSAFQANLAKYRHDSRIVDSITRMARQDPILRSDSLYRVYRLALRPNGVSVAEVNLLSCLETALMMRYGVVPAKRVTQEVQDTVYRDRGIKDPLQYFLDRAPNSGVIDSRNCDRETVAHRNTIDGTRLDAEPSPPRYEPGRK